MTMRPERPVAMPALPVSTWAYVVKALRASPDAGNYLVADAIRQFEAELLKRPVVPE